MLLSSKQSRRGQSRASPTRMVRHSEQSSLAHQILTIRKAIGQSQDGKEYIETVARGTSGVQRNEDRRRHRRKATAAISGGDRKSQRRQSAKRTSAYSAAETATELAIAKPASLRGHLLPRSDSTSEYCFFCPFSRTA